MAHRHASPRVRDEDLYTAGHLFGAWEPRRWQPRRGNFSNPQEARLAEMVRGELIERLDERLCAAVPFFESKYGLPTAALYDLFSTVSVILFPEDFADDDEAAEEIARAIAQKAALVPRDGPIERVGLDAMIAYAKSLGIEPETIEDDPEPMTFIAGVELPASELDVLRRRGR